jgi:hypothetical protein
VGVTKLKRGRLWYIACKTPIPYPQDTFTARPVSRQVNFNLPTPSGAAPVLRPLRQPLYDNKTLVSGEPIRPATLFTNDTLGEYGYYRGEKGEIIWKANWDAATAFDTREDAESRAFEVVMEFPHLIGKLIVMKLKVRFGS